MEYHGKIIGPGGPPKRFIVSLTYPRNKLIHSELSGIAFPINFTFGVDRAKAGVCDYNITKCCTEVCPEHIHITDNAIIPLKERVVDRYYDRIVKLLGLFSSKNK